MIRNKYVYVHVVQGHYGQGWEDLCQSEDYKEAQANFREYNENESTPHRLIGRRELNPELTLRERLTIAGIQHEGRDHATDLYVLFSDEAMNLILDYSKLRGFSSREAKIFKSEIDGKLWIDVPFGYGL